MSWWNWSVREYSNPNPVLTGLKLSYEEDEHNSSITFACDSMTAALPVISSLGDNLKLEVERLKKEKRRFFALSLGSFFSPLKHLPILSHHMQSSYLFFLTFSSTQTSSYSLSYVYSHHTYLSHIFPPLKHILILSHTYALTKPILYLFFLSLTISST